MRKNKQNIFEFFIKIFKDPCFEDSMSKVAATAILISRQ